jgi:hypothetical protein
VAKIRTLADLQAALDTEMGWRVKEIMTFKMASRESNGQKKYYIRAGVALLYAHWEGFVKTSSQNYLDFVDNQNLTYRQLKSCFSIFGLKSKLDLLGKSRKSQINIEAFDFIQGNLDCTAKLNFGSAIDTESNLTSAVFLNIATSLDISIVEYETKFQLIDSGLVRRRNKIAHGEYLDLNGKEFAELVDDVLVLLRAYKGDLENAASLKSYERSTVAVI